MAKRFATKDERQQIKEKVKERYGRIALAGNSSEGCCALTECCGGRSSNRSSLIHFYYYYEDYENEILMIMWI